MVMIYLLVAICVLGAAGWLAWQYFGNSAGAARDARIGVSEIASIDGKRKLLLIHRDGVEHLVMTGGPVDLVIEQGIQQQRDAAPVLAARPAQPVRAAAQAYELAQPAHHVAAAVSVDAGPELPPGFGRLRQRSAATTVSTDPFQRSDAAGQVAGGGGR